MMTKLEMVAYDQMVLAREAEQKAEDLGDALDLLLNGGFERFHTARTSDGATHEFLSGLAGLVRSSAQTQGCGRMRVFRKSESYFGKLPSGQETSTDRLIAKTNSKCRPAGSVLVLPN